MRDLKYCTLQELSRYREDSRRLLNKLHGQIGGQSVRLEWIEAYMLHILDDSLSIETYLLMVRNELVPLPKMQELYKLRRKKKNDR